MDASYKAPKENHPKQRKVQRDSTCNFSNLVAKDMYWTAPELVLDPSEIPTVKSDVYSFSIVLIEIFTREDPYAEHRGILEPWQVMQQVTENELRPDINQVYLCKVIPAILHYSGYPTKRDIVCFVSYIFQHFSHKKAYLS